MLPVVATQDCGDPNTTSLLYFSTWLRTSVITASTSTSLTRRQKYWLFFFSKTLSVKKMSCKHLSTSFVVPKEYDEYVVS